MKKEKDELTDLFRSRLGDARMPVREYFWEDLQRDIFVIQRQRRQIFYRFSAAASVLLLLAGVSAAFWYFSPKDEIADAFTQVVVSTAPSGNMGADVVKEDFSNIHASSVRQVPASVNHGSGIGEDEDEDSFSMSFSMSLSLSSSLSSFFQDHFLSECNDVAYTEESENEEKQFQSTLDNASVLPVSIEKRKIWGVKLFTGGSIFSDRSREEGLLMLTKKNNSLNIQNAGNQGAISRQDFSSEADYENYQRIAAVIPENKKQTRMKHKLPISAGVTVCRELSKSFSLESGLVYTRLSAELTAGEGAYYKQDQTLHYVGIPVKANFTLHKTKPFNLYAAAGGMVEKCVSGKVKTVYYDNGEKIYSSSNSLKTNNLQFSLSASVGVEYKLNNYLSLYVEPGLSYYFDDGSPVVTIRKENPLNMNLLCGARVSY